MVRWPVTFVLVFFLAGYLLIEPWTDEREALWTSFGVLKWDYVLKKQQVANLEALRYQLVEVERQLEAYKGELPDTYDLELKHIRAAAARRRVRIEEVRQGVEVKREFYAVLPVHVRITGRFHDLGAFLAEFRGAPGCPYLWNWVLQPSGAGQLKLEGWLQTHRYLTDEEVAAQRKKPAAKGGGA
jgi:type IV pilus assembly protein PilO